MSATELFPGKRDSAKVMNRTDLSRRLVARLRGDEAIIGGIGNTTTFTADGTGAIDSTTGSGTLNVAPGTSTLGGEGTVFGAIIGALIMQSLGNGLQMLNVNSNLQYMIKGFVLILAVWADISNKKKKA